MSDIETKNALIRSTFLGKAQGCLTCHLTMDSNGMVQYFGGYPLDELHEIKAGPVRLGSAFGMEFIRLILKALQVDKWEDLAGTYCRIKADRSKIHAIGHITKDTWFEPEKDLEFMVTEEDAK